MHLRTYPFQLVGGRRRRWRMKVLFSLTLLVLFFFIYLFIIFNRQQNMHVHSWIHYSIRNILCAQRERERETASIIIYTHIHVMYFYTFENVLFYFCIWVTGWLAGCLTVLVWPGLIWSGIDLDMDRKKVDAIRKRDKI